VLAIGLILRGLASERAGKKRVTLAPAPVMSDPKAVAQTLDQAAFRDPLLCAVLGVGKTLDFAIEEARETARALYVLFVREQAVVTPEDARRKWHDDPIAKQIFEYAQNK